MNEDRFIIQKFKVAGINDLVLSVRIPKAWTSTDKDGTTLFDARAMDIIDRHLEKEGYGQ